MLWQTKSSSVCLTSPAANNSACLIQTKHVLLFHILGTLLFHFGILQWKKNGSLSNGKADCDNRTTQPNKTDPSWTCQLARTHRKRVNISFRRLCIVQIISVPWPIGSSRRHRGTIQQRSSTSLFFAGGPCEQFRHGQGCQLFDVVHPTFLLSTTASSTLPGALKEGFGEAVMECESRHSLLVECWTCDQKVASLSPTAGEFSSQELTFCADSYPVSLPSHVTAVACKRPVIPPKAQVAICKKTGRQRNGWRSGHNHSSYLNQPKKGNLKQCQSYHTISPINHPSKIMLRVILHWLKAKAELAWFEHVIHHNNLGGWAMLWLAGEMVDGQHQRLGILAHAKTAHKGLLRKRLEEDLCWIIPHIPLMT